MIPDSGFNSKLFVESASKDMISSSITVNLIVELLFLCV